MLNGRFWGNLERLDQKPVYQMAKDASGREYVADTAAIDERWTLRCECGQVFDILRSEMPPKVKFRNCQGRNPDCPHWAKQTRPASKGGRPPLADPGMAAVLYLRTSMWLKLREEAKRREVSMSKLAGELLEKGYAYEALGEDIT